MSTHTDETGLHADLTPLQMRQRLSDIINQKTLELQEQAEQERISSKQNQSHEQSTDEPPTNREGQPQETQAESYDGYEAARKHTTQTNETHESPKQKPNESINYQARNINNTHPYLAEIFERLQAVWLWKFEQQPKYNWIKSIQRKYSQITIEETFYKIERYCINNNAYTYEKKKLAAVFNTFANRLSKKAKELPFSPSDMQYYELAFAAYSAAYKHYFKQDAIITDHYQKLALIKLMKRIRDDQKKATGKMPNEDLLIYMLKKIIHVCPKWIKKNPNSFTPKALYHNYGGIVTNIKNGVDENGKQRMKLSQKDIENLKYWGRRRQNPNA